jgi:hypothetical protein
MRNPWKILRCQLRSHRWETVEVGGDKGWKCRNCQALVLEREYLERGQHDPDEPDRPVWSAGSPPPTSAWAQWAATRQRRKK